MIEYTKDKFKNYRLAFSIIILLPNTIAYGISPKLQ